MKSDIRRSVWGPAQAILCATCALLGWTQSAVGGGSWLSGAYDIRRPTADLSMISHVAAELSGTTTPQTAIDLVISFGCYEPTGNSCTCEPAQVTPDMPLCDNPWPPTSEQHVYESVINYWAEAICEQTNAGLKLRTVYIFRNGAQNSLADLDWQQNQGASARPAGFRGFGDDPGTGGGLKMFFGDNVLSGSDGVITDDDERKAGYALGHEFAHYVLGLFDEYKKKSPGGGDYFPAGNDTDQVSPSIMNRDYEDALPGAPAGLNHSTQHLYSDLGIGQSKQTAQWRVYQKSGWEVLQQSPNNDGGNPNLATVPSRTQFSVLSDQAIPDLAPSATDSADLRKPDGTTVSNNYVKNSQSACSDEPTIRWMSNDIALQLVIDRSGSMGTMNGIPLTNAKAAAKTLINDLDAGTEVGLTAFATSVAPMHELYGNLHDLVFATDGISPPCNPSDVGNFTTLTNGSPAEDFHREFCTTLDSSLNAQFQSHDTVTIDIKDTDSGVKKILKSLVDSIDASGSTALYKAALDAYEDLADFPEDLRLVFLLSDGKNTVSGNGTKDEVICVYQGHTWNETPSQCQNTNPPTAVPVPLSTFAYGDFAPEGVLRELADATAGVFRKVPVDSFAAQGAFLTVKAQLTASSAAIQASDVLTAKGTASIPFAVDSTQKELPVFVEATTDHSDDVEFALLAPGGVDSGAHFTCSEAGGAVGCSTVVSEEVLHAHPPGAGGPWTVAAKNLTDTEIPVKVEIYSNPQPVVPYDLTLNSLEGATVTYPAPLLLTAIPSRGQSITGARVVGTITDADGEEREIAFRDDGEGVDWLARDGVYSAIADYDKDGVHTISVRVDNPNLDASMTEIGLLDVDEPSLERLEENFTRTANIQVAVTGVAESTENGVLDDHHNVPPGTPVVADNSHVPGRIEEGGDVDVFQVKVWPDDADGERPDPLILDLRITDVTLDMVPQLRVEQEDGSTLVEPTTIDDLSEGAAYLSVSVPVPKDTEFLYAYVTHADRENGTGYYEISAGPRIVSDPPVLLAIDIKPDSEENLVIPYWPGDIVVALLGSEGYDLHQINPETLAFGPGRAAASNPNGGIFKDVNGDALDDYVNTYSVLQSGIRPGDTQACLSGQLGETPFIACDTIRTVPRLWLYLVLLGIVVLLLLMFRFVWKTWAKRSA